MTNIGNAPKAATGNMLHRESIKTKFIGVGIGLAVVPLLICLLVVYAQSRQLGEEAVASTTRLGNNDVDHIVEGVYALCNAQQQNVATTLQVAHQAFLRAGNVSFLPETVSWEAVNQFSRQTRQIDLPKMAVGGRWLGNNSEAGTPSPIVDEVQKAAGSACTVFQRMNDRGDMLRVCTTVKDAQGKRAVGTYIPVTQPDGTPNPVVSCVMKGETYAGRAFVVNAWYITSYEPIYDDRQQVAGMLFVGVPERSLEAVWERVRSVRLGETGRVFIMDGAGTVLSNDGQNNGAPASVVREICQLARELKPGQVGHFAYSLSIADKPEKSRRVCRFAYLKPWDWVIAAEAGEEELQAAASRVRKISRSCSIALAAMSGLALGGMILIRYFVLRVARTDLESVIASIPDPFMVIDKDYRIVLANRAVQDTFGADPVRNGLRCHQVSHHRDTPCDSLVDPCPLEKVFATGRPVRVMHVHPTSTGEPRYIDIVASPICDRSGKVLRVIEACRDVTDQKRAEEAIHLNEARLVSLLRISQQESGNVQDLLDFALEQAIQLTGSKIGYIYHYSEDRREFVLNTWSKSVMDECRIVEKQTVYSLEKTGVWGEAVRQRRPIVVNDYHAPHPLKKGCPEGHAPLHKFMTVPVFAGKEIVAVVGVANKATDYDEADVRQLTLLMGSVWRVVDRRRAQEEAQRETAKLSSMISGMDEGVAFASTDGVVVEINEFLCRLTGKNRQEILGQRIEDLYAEPVRGQIPRLIEACRNNVASRPLVHQQAIGQTEVLLRTQPIYRDGAYDGVLLNVVDVTELVAARQQLESANQQLEAAIGRANEMAVKAETADMAKSEFLANMSHEIRTPLTAILGYSELLQDEEISLQERQEHSRVILRNGRHLLELVNDILDISKIEADKLVLEQRPCSIQAIVADVVSMMRVRAIEKHLALTVRYVTPVPQTILTDEARLRQVLINLVSNAIKFTQTGEVSVSIGLPQGGANREPALRLDVSDTGIGMSAETIQQLFQPFVQADSSTTRKYGGTGLGLTIAKRIVEKMGGEIQVQSTPGQGSVFTLIVPTGSLAGIALVEHVAEAVAEMSNQPERMPSLQGLRILLAEDGPDNQMLLQRMLSKAGAEVEVADNGRLAVQAAAEHSFDLILMDMQMPEMDGYEAAGCLRSKGCSTPIIALTAHALSSDRERCLEAGCTEYLTKPIHRTALIDMIVKLVGGRPASLDGANAPADKPDTPGKDAIVSDFANDKEMTGIIDSFVRQLPLRCQGMREALGQNDFPTLQRLAHQMKGAGGSYGYPMLTQAGKELEAAARAGDSEECVLKLASLSALCQAIGRGLKTEEAAREQQS